MSFKVLSIDGGGIRGAFPTALLAQIEAETEKPIADQFDLIVGTSTGGIVAAAIACRIPCSDIEQMYSEQGQYIFSKSLATKTIGWIYKGAMFAIASVSPGKQVISQSLFEWLITTKYDSRRLREVLVSVFGIKTFENISDIRLCITSIDLTKGSTVVFKTPHLPNLTRDRRISIVDALMASSAAPTFFNHASIDKGQYCDGGLWANNPSAVALAECYRLGDEEQETARIVESIRLLSIGTGNARYSYSPPNNAGLGWWATRIPELMMISSSQGIHHVVENILGHRYLRINFELPDKHWRLDSVDKIDQLIHIGREKAHEKYTEIMELLTT